MSENLRDKIAEAARGYLEDLDVICPLDERNFVAGDVPCDEHQRLIDRLVPGITDAVLAVVGPELDRLRAEVERLRMGAPGSVVRSHVEWLKNRAEDAEAERDVLRARLAKVEALADKWANIPPYDTTAYDQGRVDQRHMDTEELLAALASVPEPSDSEPAPCRCHDTHAAITARHEGHCCFYPADRKCHPTEVEAWAAAHRALTEAAPDADREAGGE